MRFLLLICFLGGLNLKRAVAFDQNDIDTAFPRKQWIWYGFKLFTGNSNFYPSEFKLTYNSTINVGAGFLIDFRILDSWSIQVEGRVLRRALSNLGIIKQGVIYDSRSYSEIIFQIPFLLNKDFSKNRKQIISIYTGPSYNASFYRLGVRDNQQTIYSLGYIIGATKYWKLNNTKKTYLLFGLEAFGNNFINLYHKPLEIIGYDNSYNPLKINLKDFSLAINIGIKF